MISDRTIQCFSESKHVTICYCGNVCVCVRVCVHHVLTEIVNNELTNKVVYYNNIMCNTIGHSLRVKFHNFVIFQKITNFIL